MASYPEPDTMDAQGWGALTASVISAARYHSAELDTADSERLNETVFDGLLSQPDGFSRYAARAAARETRARRARLGRIRVRLRPVEKAVLQQDKARVRKERVR